MEHCGLNAEYCGDVADVLRDYKHELWGLGPVHDAIRGKNSTVLVLFMMPSEVRTLGSWSIDFLLDIDIIQHLYLFILLQPLRMLLILRL